MSVSLNIGSGQRPFAPPFLNIDCQARWNPDHVLDMSRHEDACWFADNSADMIVLHHCFEHLDPCRDGSNLLDECYRILRPDCPLLIFVPDMLQLAHMWLEGRLTDETYFINVYGAYMGDEADRHKFGFTYETMKLLLESHKFQYVRKFNWRTIPGADIAEASWVLGMEGMK